MTDPLMFGALILCGLLAAFVTKSIDIIREKNIRMEKITAVKRLLGRAIKNDIRLICRVIRPCHNEFFTINHLQEHFIINNQCYQIWTEFKSDLDMNDKELGKLMDEYLNAHEDFSKQLHSLIIKNDFALDKIDASSINAAAVKLLSILGIIEDDLKDCKFHGLK